MRQEIAVEVGLPALSTYAVTLVRAKRCPPRLRIMYLSHAWSRPASNRHFRIQSARQSSRNQATKASAAGEWADKVFDAIAVPYG
jgi:hypothetical protein